MNLGLCKLFDFSWTISKLVLLYLPSWLKVNFSERVSLSFHRVRGVNYTTSNRNLRYHNGLWSYIPSLSGLSWNIKDPLNGVSFMKIITFLSFRFLYTYLKNCNQFSWILRYIPFLHKLGLLWYSTKCLSLWFRIFLFHWTDSYVSIINSLDLNWVSKTMFRGV